MHQLILIAAMSTTTGLFGGKHCGGKVKHARPVAQGCYSAAPCGGMSPYAAPQSAPMSYPASPQAISAPMPTPGAPVPPAPAAPPAPPAPPAASLGTTPESAATAG